MAAGPWYTGSGIGDANIAVAARTIQAALHSSAKNREIMAHPVIRRMLAMDEQLPELLGALGVSISLLAVGQGKLAATAEGTEATPTSWATANSATVTPARRAWARDSSDFARVVQEALLTGEITPDLYAILVYEGWSLWGNDIVDRLAALAASASFEIGTTNMALTWAAVQTGVLAAKDRGVVGNGLGLIDAKGAGDLSSDALSLGGAIQFRAQTQQFVSNSGQGAYLGTEWGIDWYLCGELDAVGVDTLGIVLWDDAALSKHQRVPLPPREAIVLADLGFLTIEARRPGGGVTRAETVSYNAIGIREAARFSAIRYKTV